MINHHVINTHLVISNLMEIGISFHLSFSYNQNDLKNNNIYIIAVPTPIERNKKPDLRKLIKATKIVAKYINPNDIVIYESTVYPGTTEEVCVPIIEKISGLKLSKNIRNNNFKKTDKEILSIYRIFTNLNL